MHTNHKIYETNSALGHNELAYLLHIKNNMYMVIDTNDVFENYVIGNVIKLDEEYVSKSDYKLNKSPLFNNHMFQYFLNNALTHKSCSNCKKRNIGPYEICSIVDPLQRQYLNYDEDKFSCNQWEKAI